MLKQTKRTFWGFVIVFLCMGICLSISLELESNLAYGIAYVLCLVSIHLNIKMFENNPLHKDLNCKEKSIAALIIVLIAAYLGVTQIEHNQPISKIISAGVSSFLFTYSLFLLSFVVSNIKK